MRCQLLRTGAMLHALKMRMAVFELRQIEFERNRAPKAPEEIRVRRGKVIKKPFAALEQVFNNGEILEQKFVADFFHVLG